MKVDSCNLPGHVQCGTTNGYGKVKKALLVDISNIGECKDEDAGESC